MSACLEIRPDRYTIVVGPKFTAKVLQEIQPFLEDASSHLPKFAFKDIVDAGISFLQASETFPNEAERTKYEVRYKNAYELDPAFVARKIVRNLKKCGRYEEWLLQLFDRGHPVPAGGGQQSRSLHHLLQLQSLGALLVYVHCDDLLSRTANLEPVLIEDENQLERWGRGECAGFLHVHGVYHKPETVKFDCELYDDATHPMHGTADRLREMLRSRHTVLLGDDWNELLDEPLLAKFCESFVSHSPEVPSFVLTAKPCTELPGLPLYVASSTSIASSLAAWTGNSAALWEQINLPATSSSNGQHQAVCLLIASQHGARQISTKMFDAPGVNFALVNPVNYGGESIFGVVLRVLSSSLGELWQWLLCTQHKLFMANGLMSIVLQNGTFFWTRERLTSSSSAPPSLNGDISDKGTPDDSDYEAATLNSGCDTGSFKPELTHQESFPNSTAGRNGMNTNQPTKIIKRYKVVRRKHLQCSSPVDAFYFPNHTSVKENSAQLTYAPRSLLGRRCSLPSVKTEERSSTLAQLADKLQHNNSAQIPTYAAIKRALLSDKFKHHKSITKVLPPSSLLGLLRAKHLLHPPRSTSNDISLRRNSDPGMYLHEREKLRRRQLFADESRSWAANYGSIIERKIQKWQAKRQERLQRKLLYMQSQLTSGHQHNGIYDIRLFTTPAQQVANTLHSVPAGAPAAAVSAPVSSSLSQTFLTSGVNGMTSPFMYQQTVLPNNLASTQMVFQAPFVSPYTLLNSYNTMPTSTFYVPQGAITDAQQQIVFIPSASPSPSVTPTTVAVSSCALSTTANRPSFSSLLAPTTASPSPPALVNQHHQHISSPTGSKRRNLSLPGKLPSLLQSPPRNGPDSPLVKKYRSASQPNTVQAVSAFVPSSNSYFANYHSSPTKAVPFSLEQCLIQPTPHEHGSVGSPHSLSSTAAGGDCCHENQMQLWQFLLELLLETSNSHLIEWTRGGQEYEFQIINPTEVALLWGKCTNNSTMNYNKLVQGLRFYYSKGIISKADGKKLTFRYNGQAKSYVKMRCAQAMNMNVEEIVVVE